MTGNLFGFRDLELSNKISSVGYGKQFSPD